MNNIVWKATVLGLLGLVLLMGSGVVQAQTGCTNYNDFLHWISEPAFDDRAENIFVQGDYAYIPFWNSGVSKLVIVDFTNESLPVQVGEVDIPSPDAISVAVVGNIAAVGCATNSPGGLFLVDVSDPMAPVVVDSCLPGVNGKEMAVSGTTFYMASSLPDNRLYVVDVANPDSIVVHPSVPLPRLIRGDIAISGGYAYIADGDLVTVNISDPSNAYVTNVQILPDNRNVSDLAYYNGWLYVASQENIQFSVIYSFSLGNPAVPYRRAGLTTDYPGGTANWPEVAVAAGVCYYGISSYYINMYDVSSPTSMSYVDHLPHPGGYLTDMTVFGGNLYDIRDITQGGLYPDRDHEIRVTSVSSPSPLEPISSLNLAGETLGVVLSSAKSNIAYVAGGTAGLQVVDVSNPLAPALLGTANTPGQATEIVLVGNTAYVADGSAGLQIVDVTNSNLPSVVDGVDTPGNAVDLAVAGDFAYVADSAGGLRVVDLSTPSPTLRGATINHVDVQGVALSGTVALCADGSGGAKAVDVSEPDNPWIIDGVKGINVGNALRVDISQGKAFVSDKTNGLAIVDFSDPTNLQIVSELATENTAGDVDVFGIFAYVGSGAGVQLIDIRDDQNPVNVGKVVVPATSQGMFINQDYAYVATGASGLQVCPTQCGFDESVFAAYEVDVPEAQYPVSVQFTNETVGYGLSYEWDFDDGSPISTELNPSHTFTQPRDYEVTLTATNGVNVDVFTMTISAVDEPATFLGVRDVPNDQGGWVYLDFYHSGYDNGTLNKAEVYTIQRQDDGAWVYISSIGATGDHYYTVLAPTQGNGATEWDTTFRIIANMAEGNWASAPMNGHSLDNIAPQAPQNLVWSGPETLTWDAVPDVDFSYYRIYTGSTTTFGDAESVTTTIQTQVDLIDLADPWVFVVAVDHAQQESQPSSPVAVSGIPGVHRKVWLAQATPNPFNPHTTIEFNLPERGHARLRVFDLSGRLVKVMADGMMPAGRQEAVWHGDDESGRAMASGTYFYRLDAEGTVLTRRMALLR